VNRLQQLGESGRVAQLCDVYSNSGYGDQFLPSKDELDLMYKNLKTKGLGGFSGAWYWSSSEYGNLSAWSQSFSDGFLDYYPKSSMFSVRPIRAF
jgi:hypothetical protein